MTVRVVSLEEENKRLKLLLQEKDRQLSSFLSSEQIEYFSVNKKYSWIDESVIKGLKFRFALGKHGLNYLRSTAHPFPAYSTLNKRIQNVEFNFGVMQILLSLLKAKVQAMPLTDRNCYLLIDEMGISSDQDFDSSKMCFFGNTTLGEANVAKHYLVGMLKGLKLKATSDWNDLVYIKFINLTEDLFCEGFQFFLPGRITQDSLENVFSQVRRKAGAKPTALQAKQVLRLVCISQFMSDIKIS